MRPEERTFPWPYRAYCNSISALLPPRPLTCIKAVPSLSISLAQPHERRSGASHATNVSAILAVQCGTAGVCVADAYYHAALGYRPCGRARCKHLAPCRPQPLVDADRVHSAPQFDRLVGLRLQPLADRRPRIALVTHSQHPRRLPMPLTATLMEWIVTGDKAPAQRQARGP